MVTAPRTRFSVDERRAQLLEHGLRLFAEHAYDEVAIEDIAREAGVSKGLLYHYFGGKRAFYVACIENAADQLFVRAQADPSTPEPIRARAGIEAYFDYAEEHETAYVALMRSGIGSDPEVASVVERTRSRIVDHMLESMGLEPSRPVFRAASRSWIGQVEAACLHWLDHPEHVDRAVVVQLLLGGIHGTLSMAKQLDPEAPFELDAPPRSSAAG